MGGLGALDVLGGTPMGESGGKGRAGTPPPPILGGFDRPGGGLATFSTKIGGAGVGNSGGGKVILWFPLIRLSPLTAPASCEGSLRPPWTSCWPPPPVERAPAPTAGHPRPLSVAGDCQSLLSVAGDRQSLAGANRHSLSVIG